jgi:hypothetical protein
MKKFIHRNEDYTNKIRYEKSLTKQIIQDYNELRKAWDLVINGKDNITTVEKIFQKLAWIQIALHELNVQNDESIEGIHWGEIIKIKNDVRTIQNKINIKTKKINSHLR